MAEIAKTCPKCGPSDRLVIRVNQSTRQQFLGCFNWPKCEYTEPLPVDLELRLLGAAEMLGFERDK